MMGHHVRECEGGMDHSCTSEYISHMIESFCSSCMAIASFPGFANF